MKGIEIKIVNEELRDFGIPEIKTKGSAAFDLRAVGLPKDGVTIEPGCIFTCGTGIALNIGDPSIAAIILPRSSMGKRRIGLANTFGLIDSDYQGEIMLVIENRSKTDRVVIAHGERIVQLVFIPVVQVGLFEVDEFCCDTERGTNGFGHTGAV